MTVTQQCLINFKIVGLHGNVLCDMIMMDSCHLLLGRSWQYDLKMIYDIHRNKVTTVKDSRRF